MTTFKNYSSAVSELSFSEYLDQLGFVIVTDKNGGINGNHLYVIKGVNSGKLFEVNCYQSSGFNRTFTAYLSEMKEVSKDYLKSNYFQE